MNRVHITTVLAATLTIFSGAPTLSQGANENGRPCPDNSVTTRSGTHVGDWPVMLPANKAWSTVPFFPRLAARARPHQPSRRMVQRGRCYGMFETTKKSAESAGEDE